METWNYGAIPKRADKIRCVDSSASACMNYSHPSSSITVPFLHTYLRLRTPNWARREALWPNWPAWSGRPPACPLPLSRWQVQIQHEHAVFLSVAVTSQPGVCVCVCSCGCDFYRRNQRGLSGRTAAGALGSPFSPPCLSHVPLQSGGSTAERKPITRSVPPDPRWMPNGQVFPIRYIGAAVEQRHLLDMCRYWHIAEGGRIIASWMDFRIYKNQKTQRQTAFRKMSECLNVIYP